MSMKKILCLCLALVLALAMTGCSNSKVVQAKLDEATAANADLQAQLDEANAANAQLQEQLTAAEAASTSDAESATAASADLQAQLDEANPANAQLQEQLTTAETANADLQAELTAAQSANTDLQAELTAAQATNTDLQAELTSAQELADTYYPYYAAQIVATYGENGIIWLKDVQEAYNSVCAQYASYGLDLAAYGMEDTVKMDLVASAVEDAVIKAKATELGLDQFDEATLADFEASADAMMQSYVEYYISYFYPEATEITDEMRAEAEAYWTSTGFSREAYAEALRDDAVNAAVYDYVTGDVTISDEEVQAAYEALIAKDQERYANDNSYYNDISSGATIAWNPEGYRTVKHVLIGFNDEQTTRYNDLQSQLTSLNAEREAILAAEPTEAAEGTEPTEAVASTEPTESAAPTEAVEAAAPTEAVEGAEPTESAAPMRTLEEVDADIAACNAELDALYAELMPTAEEVVAAFNAGTSFDDLIAQYNQDPGMTTEPIASFGYPVSAASTIWDPAFTAGAMSIAEVGQISEPVRGVNGIHIIYYLSDITPGTVALDEIRDEVAQLALDDKIAATYNDQVAAWVEEANVEYFYANFGIAG